MKIEYISGCTCDTLNVDGEETRDMDMEKFKSILKTLIDREGDKAVLQDVLVDLMESQGTHQDLGHCDYCGDWIFECTLEL